MSSFADRLTLVLAALSLSRGRLAAEMGVDKSLVGRWCSGNTSPSAYNLDRLTNFVAARSPGFTMLDWQADLAVLAARFGVEPPRAPVADGLPGWDWLSPTLLSEAMTNTRMNGEAFEGIWRTTRPSADSPGMFAHDHMLQYRAPNGLLRYRLGVWRLRFDGWALPIQNQLFSMASDPVSGVFIFSIVKGVARRKAMVLDGISLTCLRNTDGDIVATPCIFERVADLTGDAVADEARFEAFMEDGPIHSAPDAVSDEIRAHLLPDVGPTAAAAGGEMLMLMRFANSLSRAAPVGGDLPDAP
jgi:transcriptional regulator with XRE-family HTH domain